LYYNEEKEDEKNIVFVSAKYDNKFTTILTFQPFFNY